MALFSFPLEVGFVFCRLFRGFVVRVAVLCRLFAVREMLPVFEVSGQLVPRLLSGVCARWFEFENFSAGGLGAFQRRRHQAGVELCLGFCQQLSLEGYLMVYIM